MRLDVDDSALKKKFLLQGEPSLDEPLPALRTTPIIQEEQTAPKVVVPNIGKCYKYRDEKSGKKYFLNLCHTDEIPSPDDISASELADLIYSSNADTYRIPLSSGGVHEEKDKAGESCQVFDVAVSTQFFSKIVTEPLFGDFFLNVASSLLNQKYGLVFKPDAWIQLSNRRSWGKIQPHTIVYRNENPLVREIPQVTRIEMKEKESTVKPLLTEVSSTLLSPEQKEITTKTCLQELHGQTFLKAVFQIKTAVQDIIVEFGENVLRIEIPAYQQLKRICLSEVSEMKGYKITKKCLAVANSEDKV
ncbi:hypothetical protein QYM36_009093 [Artemia franciscana]|nr:hypothetical protein QYM36_009093 [Artemia franciscana]KAK2714757.1 hypothetical protein QYM36_009093 [Artemia franciscana]